jgi:diaminohydroxyphosphoribosylaminopyrimidine deaminase/5-amino-6-(5-phosphoribosylamino)uracil reductase
LSSVNPLNIIDECAALALEGKGYTKTNPIVGAIVVKNGNIIGRGFHEAYGKAHAEVMAIESAGDVRGADLYVTLEPCSHYGKTPPCVQKIIESGIKRVFVGVVDPNPVNAGKGLDILMEAGVEVFLGYREELCAALIEDFTKRILTSQPYYSLKTATSIDGKLATKTGDSKWITSPSSRAYGHYLRSVSDAVLVGVNTVITDDPQLTVRDVPSDNEPYKIVIDPNGRMPKGRKLEEDPEKLIYVTADQNTEIALHLKAKGSQILELEVLEKGLNLKELSEKLVEMKIMNVLIEGGGETAGTFFDAGLIDKGYFFIAPKIIGGRDATMTVTGDGASTVLDGYNLLETDVRQFEKDFLISGRFTDYRTHVLELTEKLRNRCSRGL